MSLFASTAAAADTLTGCRRLFARLLHHCRYLNISNNEIEGALPTLPTSLVSVDISSNKLSGSLPTDMSGYASLVDIQVGAGGL